MSGRLRLWKTGQVSLEVLLLTGIVIFLCISVLSYYTRINDSSIAMQLLKSEALRAVDEKPEMHVINNIEFSISGSTLKLCIFTEPDRLWGNPEKSDLEALIKGRTGFDTVTIFQIPDPDPAGSCD